MNDKNRLIAGFLAIGVGNLAALTSPVSGYEASIYTDTPLLTWIGFFIALVVFSTGIFGQQSIVRQSSGLGFTLLAASFLYLPLQRGYYMFGRGDSYSHLGHIGDLLAGIPSEDLFIYPALHMLTAVIVQINGLPARLALPLVSLSFPLLAIVVGAAVVGRISHYKYSWQFGLLTGACFLPILNINAGNVTPQPASQSIFVFLMSIYSILLLIKLTNNGWRRVIILNFTFILSLLLYHPMRGVNLVIFLSGAIVALWLSRVLSQIKTPQQSAHLLISLIRVLLISSLLYSWHLIEQVGRAISIYTIQLLRLSGDGFGPGGGVGSTALNAVGSGYFDLGIKVLIVPGLFCILTTTLLWFVYHSDYWTNRQEQTVLVVLVGGLMTMVPFWIFVQVTGLFLTLRHLTVVLAVVIVTGALSVVKIYNRVDIYININTVVFVFLILIVLSSVTVFPSGLLLKQGQHVPAENVQGYETMIEYRGEDVYFSSLRNPVSRYKHVLFGVSQTQQMNLSGVPPASPRRNQVPEHFGNQSLETYYSNTHYVVVAASGRQLYLDTFGGYRYNESDFAYLHRSDAITQVYDAGGYHVYRVLPK